MVLFLSLSCSGRAKIECLQQKVYKRCWKEWAGWCTEVGVPNNAISGPKLVDILVHYLGLDWLGKPLVLIILLFLLFLEPYHLYKTLNHLIISKLRHHFHLQCLPLCKSFHPWDVDHLLSLLQSWAPACPLSNFKLAWKTTTLLTFVTAKCYYGLALLHIDNQLLFLQHHLVVSGGKMDRPGHLPPQIYIESHSDVELCPVIYVKAYLCGTGPFRKKSEGFSCVRFVFG